MLCKKRKNRKKIKMKIAPIWDTITDPTKKHKDDEDGEEIRR